jgi:hypothetical protein
MCFVGHTSRVERNLEFSCQTDMCPMKVVSGSDSRHPLYDLITRKEQVYHVSDMKPFVYDPTVTTPLDVARRDYMAFFVQTIIDQRGNVKRKTDLEFSVSWLGYDDSWLP